MEERNIKLEEIALLISTPDIVLPQGPKWILAKSFPDRRDNLVAAVLLERQEKDLWIVITVMVRFEKRK